jgi:putative adhesin
MKLIVLLLSFVLVLVPAGARAHDDDHKNKMHVQQIERSVEADSSVTVALCVKSGSITVRGWDKNQVLARSSDVTELELKRGDGPNESGPATKLTVLMVDRADAHRAPNDCQAFGDVELTVPRAASVHVQTGDGEINISDVASVYAKSQSGTIEIERASQSVEAVSFSSDVSVKHSTGRIALKSVGGDLTATDLRPADGDDCFDASTISGDIEFEGVSHSLISARTVNGEVRFAGPLAHAGQYTFNTTTGDVNLKLPPDASFRLVARISQEAEITSDFPLTLKIETSSAPSPKPYSVSTEVTTKQPAMVQPVQPAQPAASAVAEPLVIVEQNGKIIKVNPLVVVKPGYLSRRVTAVHGTGDARISVVTFSGSVHLQKDSAGDSEE